MNNLQIIMVSVFLAFFVFAVLIFSGLIKVGSSSSSTTPQGKVVIWGTFSNNDIFKAIEDANADNKDLNVTYVAKNNSTYQQDLIEAFAQGKGPDLFILPSDLVSQNEQFVYKVPFASYPEKTFRDSFIDGADAFLSSDGVVAFPLVVDPMVMYYNKDILANEGIALPPQTWDELYNLNSTLTKKKDDGTILQSMIALGRYDNVTHSKDILATLLLQSGNPIVQRTSTGFSAVLNENVSSQPVAPVEAILKFFIDFSNPSSSAYSWNRALPNSLDMFTSGKLAMYLGRASELFAIQSINPNLSFDVTQILQTKGTNVKRTYGRIYGIAVNKKSTNITAAFTLAGILTTGDAEKNFAAAVSLPPASKALLANRPTDPYLFTFFNSAIITRTWLDPDPSGSDAIFGELVQNIVSNKLSLSDAINKAQSQLDIITK